MPNAPPRRDQRCMGIPRALDSCEVEGEGKTTFVAAPPQEDRRTALYVANSCPGVSALVLQCIDQSQACEVKQFTAVDDRSDTQRSRPKRSIDKPWAVTSHDQSCFNASGSPSFTTLFRGLVPCIDIHHKVLCLHSAGEFVSVLCLVCWR